MTTTKNKLKDLLGSSLKDFETAINAIDEAVYAIEEVMANLEHSEDLEKIDDMLGDGPMSWDGHFDTLEDIQTHLQNAQHTMNTYFDILNDKD
tara:strand:+ start:2049 stop:2327 length:279 start_codon:yes stop_codon:yes gene_type:complete